MIKIVSVLNRNSAVCFRGLSVRSLVNPRVFPKTAPFALHVVLRASKFDANAEL